jgi:hypothetical protein
MAESYIAGRPDTRERIAALGVEYGIATQYTSFVAVEEQSVTTGRTAKQVAVPVELPEGMSGSNLAAANRMWLNESVALTLTEQMGLTNAGDRFTRTDGTHLGVAPGAGQSADADYNRLEQFARLQRPPAIKFHDLPQVNSRIRFEEPPRAPGPPEVHLDKLDLELRTPAPSEKGEVTIQILLSDSSQGTLDALRLAGLEILRQPGHDLMLTGRIAAGKLADLTRLDAVRYVLKLR